MSCSIAAVKGQGGTDAPALMKCVTVPAYQTISRVLPGASANVDSACLLQFPRQSWSHTIFAFRRVVEGSPLRDRTIFNHSRHTELAQIYRKPSLFRVTSRPAPNTLHRAVAV
jgi:hypothetical protein